MKTKIKVEGMSCMHCAGSVKEILSEVTSEEVSVDLEKKEVLVNGTIDLNDQVKTAMNEAGYEIVGVEEIQ